MAERTGLSIQQVAQLSGVTARTLRHYDEIGLLPPTWVGANGYRYYDQAALARLQEILLLRELDVGLTTIAEVIDGRHDRLEALRQHRERLSAERDRLDTLVRTISQTITHLEEGTTMPADEMFTGFRFNRETIDELEARAAERSGDAEQHYYDELKQRTATWTDAQFREFEQESAAIEQRILALLRDGVAADDPAVFDVLDDDVATQRKLMELDAAEYAGLGQAFVAAPELRAHLDAQDPRLAGYLRDAMVAYAGARMS